MKGESVPSEGEDKIGFRNSKCESKKKKDRRLLY